MASQSASHSRSPQLLNAQAQLERLRKEFLTRGETPGSQKPAELRRQSLAGNHTQSKTAKTVIEMGQVLLEKRRRQEAKVQGEVASDTLQAYLASARGYQKDSFTNPVSAQKQNVVKSVKIYPSIATAILAAELAAPARVYWLLKYLDHQGAGWITVDAARAKLTKKDSPLRVFGWRRLRQIMAQGEGVFWQRDRVGRLWLSGPARVAQELDCSRLEGKPIAIPLSALLNGIQHVRAHFYASFHSSRRENNPICRETLSDLTSVPGRTQLEYERVTKVTCKSNLAIGGKYTKLEIEDRAWYQGRATFRFVDVQGKQGAPRKEYVAWRLPNTYQGPHSTRPKGRQKKINRQLAGLVMKGMRGNDQAEVERLFWRHGAAAGRAYNKAPDSDAYWSGGESHSRQYQFWNVLSAKGR